MIIKNFLNKKSQDQLKKLICDVGFIWNWREGLICFNNNPNESGYTNLKYHGGQEAPMFMHQVSKYEHILDVQIFNKIIKPFVKKWEKETKYTVKEIKRSQFNLYPRVSIIKEECENSLHRDIQYEDNYDITKHFSILYFVMDSDGPTITFDDEMNEVERCYPVQGNLFYYPSILLHKPTVPVSNKRRITLQIEVEVY